jgi:hypothetical protein
VIPFDRELFEASHCARLSARAGGIAAFFRPELRAHEACRFAEAGVRVARAVRWTVHAQALLFEVFPRCSFQVYDPTYFVAFEMDKDNPVGMAGAPQGCSINLLGSKPLAADDTKKLSESFFSGLSPGYDFGVKLASRIIVACP